MDQTAWPPRRLLSHSVAAALAEAHQATGLTFKAVGRLIGVDGSYWRRLTIGERCPSTPVAERIVAVLDLDGELAERLLGEAVPTRVWPTR